MRMLAFSKRCTKEMLRDPLSIVFGIGFPVVLIVLISIMQRSMGTEIAIFDIKAFAPGMAVFGLAFISLFLGQLISGDRSSSFLTRLFASPMTGWDFITGYSLPMFPLAVAQTLICFITAMFFGFEPTWNILIAIVVMIPSAALFIAFGLLLGSTLVGGQVGGAGSLIINVSAWLSGVWFPIDQMGNFGKFCKTLPFAHSFNSVKYAVSGDFNKIPLSLLIVSAYALGISVIAVYFFRRKMKG